MITCANCDTVYDRATFHDLLPAAGGAYAEGLEWRQCPCGNTLNAPIIQPPRLCCSEPKPGHCEVARCRGAGDVLVRARCTDYGRDVELCQRHWAQLLEVA